MTKRVDLSMPLTPDQTELILDKLDRYTIRNGECWQWRLSTNLKGYGLMRVGRLSAASHRASYAVHRGVIPLGLFVCHHCDNPGCANPDHLFLGTVRDNVIDALTKGRLDHSIELISARNAPRRKLTDDQVRDLRRLSTQGFTHRQLGKTFNIGASTVRAVLYGRTYQWV